MRAEKSDLAVSESATPAPIDFVRAAASRFVLISILLVIPCFWHKHIEAGDLASHTYNAWLAMLIEKGQAPGLHLAHQCSNVLFDILLSGLGHLTGLMTAEKLVVAASVLIFFWGAFSFISVITGRPPWTLVAPLAMVAYGWTFYEGLFNYYLSTGLAFFAAALFVRGRRPKWPIVIVLGGLICLAHPLGLAWLVATAVYIQVAGVMRTYKWLLLVIALGFVVLLHLYVRQFPTAFWEARNFYEFNGMDQLILFSDRYSILARISFAFGCVCFVSQIDKGSPSLLVTPKVRIPLELWTISLCLAAMIPEEIVLPYYTAPVGLIPARLTSVTAVLGLCILGCLQPKRWHVIGFAVIAAIFFAWTYRDTGVLNKTEENANAMLSRLAGRPRVLATMGPQPGSRLIFPGHIVDRSCIEHCYSYSNYEPSSEQFRVRVTPGSPIVSDSPQAIDEMQRGEYIVKKDDLPMIEVYQCSKNDVTRLCMRDLTAGEKNCSGCNNPLSQLK